MKKFYFSLFTLFFTTGILAQAPGESEQPVSFWVNEHIPPVENVIELEAPDMDVVEVEDAEVEQESGRYNIGRKLETTVSIESDGSWHYLSDGSRMWRAAFQTSGAEAVNLYFSQYNLPEGAETYVYSSDKSNWNGPYTSGENNEHGIFMSPMIFGDDLIIEYYEPNGVVGNPTLVIDGMGYFYRGVHNAYEDSRGGSDPCQVDVNCPEGDEWQAEKNSVVRLLITHDNQSSLCSGVLVNNTARDCRQLLLTALHCVQGLSEGEFGALQVLFKYEVSGCNSGFGTNNYQRIGVVKLADSNDGGGESGSDFALLEIEDDIPSGWNPYYAGWRNTNSTSPSGVSIHHPSGDYKKISTYTSSLYSVYLGAPGSHWEVKWSQTETNHGVTEGGSSGSPIFDEEHRVIGTLTGGLSFCDSPNDPDYYGKMSYHWMSNGSSEEERLAPFLDPMSTGEQEIEGSYVPCENTTSIHDNEEIDFDRVSIYPNPANEKVTVEFSEDIEVDRLEIYNSMGQKVDVVKVKGELQTISLNQHDPGVYYLTIFGTDGSQLTRKFSKL